MYLESGQLIYSPSDLTQFLDSPFASWMEHLALTHSSISPQPDENDSLMDVLQGMGVEHEAEILASFKAQKLSIANLAKTANPIVGTLAAMRQGIDVIYQAALEFLPWRGYADFLIKVKGSSRLGDYHYEVWDSKLSKTVKPSFLLQICSYAEMLEIIQGCRPEHMTVILGNGEKKQFRVDDYYFYYQALKNNFLITHQQFDHRSQPDPAASKNWGRWSNYAEELLKETDHLIQIATITSSQIKKLNKAGIFTISALIKTANKTIKGIKPPVFERLQTQARIQQESLGKEIPLYQLISNQEENKQGLALLPPASPQDIFFDIEGFPLDDGGLEYLWGVSYFDEKGIRHYRDFWAHNATEEKESFQAFIEWAYGLWRSSPAMHIYHYASYEVSACRRLMGRYGVCENEVDQLLRNHVFVDLYKVVKGALIIGEPRYSIKNVEHLYRGKRQTEVGSGGDSVVVYERWRENPDGDSWQTSTLLKGLRDYNIDDCNSTQELVDWLRQKQTEHQITYLGKTGVTEPEIKPEITERTAQRDKLLLQAQHLDQPLARISIVLAWSIEFHRREVKPVFWRLFDRLGLTADELIDDIDCLAGCQRTATPPYKPTPRSRNLAYEYRFDKNQEFKGGKEAYFILGAEAADGKNCKATYHAEGSDLQEGIIALQMKDEAEPSISLIPDEYINPDPIPQAIMAQAKAFECSQLHQTAIRDFLERRNPRIRHHQSGEPIAKSHHPETRLQEVIQAVINLDNSYLTIQGPPGSGKTYTGKRLIAELIKQGKKIGIASNSHKAINNLLINTALYCRDEKITGCFICTSNTDDILTSLDVAVVDNKTIIEKIVPGCVVGATAWGFARGDLEQVFDYLFIDEAGQVSVANLIAMSRAARNIILMGDQMQLGQPSQGSHPEESGLSVLDYLLHHTPTIPEHMGVFLGTTYRLHSVINQFISNTFYEGKLESMPANDTRRISVPDTYQGLLDKEAGIIPIPCMHEGNTQSSEEEVACITELVKDILSRTVITNDGARAVTWDDILFVAPYNHQVNKLKASLGDLAQVGSVDKFQGQEKPIVFLSMCASSVDESPRGLNFLFDKNRLNVAVSRAKCLVIVVYSPALLNVIPNSIEQMDRLNSFCRLINQD